MDWAKAKTIMIILFFLLNIFLLVNIFIERSGINVTEKVISDTETILGNNDVLLKCEIPSYTRKTASLEYNHDTVYNHDTLYILRILSVVFGEEKSFDIPVDFEQNVYKKDGKTLTFNDTDTVMYENDFPNDRISLSDISLLEKQLREYFSAFVDNIDEYVLDLCVFSGDNNINVLFTYKYKSFLVFDNSIRAEITEKGIKSFTYSHKNIKGFVQNPASIMPAHRVLLKNIEDIKGTSGEPNEITCIDIGFKGHSVGDEMMRSSEGPAWRIVLNNTQDLYYSAFDGTRIQ